MGNERQPPSFCLVAAMLKDRGIGFKNTLPWPSLNSLRKTVMTCFSSDCFLLLHIDLPTARTDYEHYIRLTSTPSASGKKCVNIKGRLTWESTGLEEKSNPNIINIVISNTLRSCPEYVSKVVGSLHEALETVAAPPYDNIVDTVWVMGGETVYKDALQSSQCRRVYLTRIDAQFPCDSFFPAFEDRFQQISVSDVDSCQQEDNGIQYKFEVYEPKTT